jgi:symplekin
VLEDAESSGAGGSAAKRRRLEVLPGSGDGRGGVIVDVSQFAVEPVVDVVMAGLSAVSDQLLKQAFDNARTAILENAPDAVRVLAPSLFTEQPKEEEAIVNPLDMELDDDELLMEPLEQDEGDETVLIADFTLPPPEPIPAGEKDGIVDVAVRRIWDGGADLAHLADLRISDAPRSAVQPKEIWMLLLARLSSRGGEDKRRLIGEFVAKDFGSRSKFATVWLNEEWLARRRGKPNQYEEGVMAVLGAYIPSLDAKDNSLKNFLVGLPEIPSQAIEALKPLCEDPDRRLVGFFSLRDLAEARPPVRQQAVATLLEFCTHPDRKIRLVAITTVRRWVPDTPMSSSLIAYALGCLRLLVARAKDIKEVKVVKEDGDEDEAKEGEAKEGEAKAEDKPETAEPEAAVVPSTLSDDDTIPDGEVVQSKYLGEVTPESVFQYVELAFALSRRDQDLLDDIFAMYAKLPASIQPVIADMFNGLVRSLGASKKLLDIVHSLPAGGDKLVLGAITVLVNEGAGDGVVEVVRELMKEREDLDPHFVIAVIDKLGKAEIESQMPAIASLLLPAPGRDVAAETEVVKKAIGFIVPRVKPADFLVFLYQETAGVEATSASEFNDYAFLLITTDYIPPVFDVCLSMPSAFPPQELEAAMKRALDGPGKIPLCFIRTVFRAILSTPQKDDKNTAAGAAGAGDKKASKLGFVHEYIKGHIISRLIAKRVWEVPALWAGFPALVQMAGRGAFSALLQMPVEQIREMTERRPKLKTMLATWLADKPTPRSQLSFLFAKDEKDKDKEVSGAGQRGEAPATVAAA